MANAPDGIAVISLHFIMVQWIKGSNVVLGFEGNGMFLEAGRISSCFRKSVTLCSYNLPTDLRSVWKYIHSWLPNVTAHMCLILLSVKFTCYKK